MITPCAKPLRAHSKNGCVKCVLQTQSFSRRAPLIPTGIFNKIFFNDCEASATINEFCSQSEPCGRAVPMNNLDRNLRFGWWSLLIFLSLGGGLEILHGFKIGWYVDVGNDMRRLMFTLAHAHGTALALVNIAAGLTARHFTGFDLRGNISASLIWAGILFPVVFILGGVVTYGGDPGLGIWLVPVAAVLLFYSVLSIARSVTRLVRESGKTKGKK